VREPYNLRLSEIGRLTDKQIFEVYCRPPKEKQQDGGQSYWDIFKAVWLRRGWTLDEVRRLFKRETGEDAPE